MSSFFPLCLILLTNAAMAQSPRQAVDRALTYLSNEVPEWKKENGCFSCHNNGDAARALMRGGKIRALESTLDFLGTPASWERQQAAAEFRDQKLALVQFSFALADATRQGIVKNLTALREAARMLKQNQAADGAWRLDQEAGIGSPATYGTALSTYAAIRVLSQAGGADAEIARARQWLQTQKPVATPDLAAQILTFDNAASPAVETLLKMQTSDGGWGPYRATSAEAFDTALAILALGRFPQARSAVDRGVTWLVKNQLENGGWPATTRPSGNISYAQHISTTGWATLALLSRLE
ncbi:MAG: terpene cyclase/mutase family protein [Acidobacteria bacterium]|nr:terpene cyclase/mutase family protein [Acidobacteriota bacterium]